MDKIKDELVERLAARYQQAERRHKSLILDELVELMRCHRKHAIRVLKKAPPKGPRERRRGRRIYDEAMREVLVLLWEASDRICGKRLRAALPGLISAMERHGHLELDATVREGVLSMSAATIDRLLTPARAERGKAVPRRRCSSASTRRSVPIRTFADWNEPAPGFFEVDFVVHCGGSMSGKFIHTLVLTDIASGWTEMIPLLARDQGLVVEAFDRVRAQLPMPLLGIDTDNDGAFINDTVINYCARTGIELTRSRPRRKNDQAWVEQKNGALIRHLVGYARYEGPAAARLLSRLYAAARLYANLYQPSFKLKSKERVGATIKKSYYPPESPAARLLAHGSLPGAQRSRLRLMMDEADPIRLLKLIRDTQEGIGEVRPTHRKKPRSPRTWRTREDPFSDVLPLLEGWINVDPDLTATIALARLQEIYPARFTDGHLRTLQRRFREWRLQTARGLVYSDFDPADLTSLRASTTSR